MPSGRETARFDRRGVARRRASGRRPCWSRPSPQRRRRSPRWRSSSGPSERPPRATAARPEPRPPSPASTRPTSTEVYSPNATWPAVRKALKGASLVIYMGHGNGYPSRYRDSLYPPTQNGFGLNPQAGTNDDTSHQYFGESQGRERSSSRPDAVVLLNHLCYASGLSEPGLARGHPRPGQAAGRQLRRRVHPGGRVGRHRRGVHEPVRATWPSILGGNRSIESIWSASPTRQRQHVRVRERPQPGLHRRDGPVDRHVRLRALDRAQDRASPRPTCSPARAAAPPTTGGFAVDPGLPTLTDHRDQARDADAHRRDERRPPGEPAGPVQDPRPRPACPRSSRRACAGTRSTSSRSPSRRPTAASTLLLPSSPPTGPRPRRAPSRPARSSRRRRSRSASVT